MRRRPLPAATGCGRARALRWGAALLAVALVAGCTDEPEPEPEEAEEPDSQVVTTDEVEPITEGALTVCLDAPMAPFVTVDDEGDEPRYGGFEVAVLREVADRLELELVVEPARLERIQSGAVLGAERCDLGGTALAVTERREEQVDFTRPFFQAHQGLYVAAERVDELDESAGVTGLESVEDLDALEEAGLRVGVREDSPAEEVVGEHLDDADVTRYEPGDLLPAVLVGDVDVAVRDLTSGVGQAAEVEGLVVAAAVPTGDPFAFALRAERTDGLGPAVDEALEAMADEGRLEALFVEYFDVE